MKVVCVNDLFTIDQHQLFEKYGIVTPKEGEEYTIRETLNTQRGKSYLLVELVNPKIPNGIPDAEGVDFFFEPNWAAWRFRQPHEVMENVLQLEEVA